jgi:predicted metal-dependent HD superfamily phosphohydrolase
MTDLIQRWPLLDHATDRDALLTAYADPARGYHDTLHLTEVLDRIEELGTDEPALRLAAWFHDAVYDGERDAEERSAVWAEQALADTPYATEVARLVRVTERHDPAEGDLGGQALCDADLAILAAPADRYDTYASGVRRDYAHVSDTDFAAGRAAVLRELAGRERLFHSAYAREHWDAPARANLARELDRLDAQL